MVHDESTARATLIAMQGRIAQGPYVALGVPEDASIDEVRGAFLMLTKQFHPARFGRMSIELQKLSNEVFLGIKSAHDLLMRASGGAARSSGGMPVIAAESSSAHRAALVPSKTPSGQHPTIGRTLTPMRGTEPPVNRPGTPSPSAQQAPTQRPGTPQTPRAGFAINPGTQPGAASRGTTQQRTAPVYDESVAFQTVLDMMKRGDYRGAREAMHALAARVPQNKQYRAYLCYVRGREAHVGGRFDEATMEYQRALQLDPDLIPAKQALLDAQRKR